MPQLSGREIVSLIFVFFILKSLERQSRNAIVKLLRAGLYKK